MDLAEKWNDFCDLKAVRKLANNPSKELLEAVKKITETTPANKPYGLWEAFYNAIERNHVRLFRYLLESGLLTGASPNYPALLERAACRSPKIFELLLRHDPYLMLRNYGVNYRTLKVLLRTIPLSQLYRFTTAQKLLDIRNQTRTLSTLKYVKLMLAYGARPNSHMVYQEYCGYPQYRVFKLYIAFGSNMDGYDIRHVYDRSGLLLHRTLDPSHQRKLNEVMGRPPTLSEVCQTQLKLARIRRRVNKLAIKNNKRISKM